MTPFGKNKFQDKLVSKFVELVDKEFILNKLALQNSSEGFAVETGGKFIIVNPAFAKIFKFQNPEDLIGTELIKLMDEKSHFKFQSDLIKVLTEKTPARSEYSCICNDNSSIFIELSISFFEMENNTYLVYGCTEITEKKHFLFSLESSEELYRELVENVDVFFINAERINGKLKPTFASPKIEKLIGYTSNDFVTDSRLWFKVTHPDDIQILKKKIKIFFKDSARFFEEIDFRVISASGNTIWLKTLLSVKRDSEGNISKVFGLLSDVTQTKKGETELIKTLHKLRESNSTKDKFISIISHDLRTPFSSILGFTDILLNDKDITTGQRDQYINFIQESSQNILSLVNSLLDWTRIQTGRIKFEPERLNAREVIEKAVTIMTGTAMQKGIQLVSLLTKDIFIHADSNLILQTFNNLISNSVKFTMADGTISILAQPSSEVNHIEFIIRDTGVGIKKENLNKLFKVDTKFTIEGTAGEKGTGLGLSIVHEIVVKHGGKIWVESEWGKGTDFHFTMPLAASSILLVDDSKTDRLLYSKILKNFIPHYKIDEAGNGKEAFEILSNNIPALIITDHKMPEMSGYDLVKQIQTSGMKRKPPIIVLSVDVNPHIMEGYKDLNIEYVFQKPVNLTALKEAVDKSLKKAIFN